MTNDPTTDLLRAESAAWQSDQADDYDRVVADLIEQAVAAPATDPRADTMLDLIDISLHRTAPALVETPGRAALALVTQLPHLADARRARACVLILVAVRRLGTVVERGPASIARAPELPPGSQLPAGADPDQITDPQLREQAARNAETHREQLERWTDRQRALRLLEEITALLLATTTEASSPIADLVADLLLVPGFPPEQQEQLRTIADLPGE